MKTAWMPECKGALHTKLNTEPTTKHHVRPYVTISFPAQREVEGKKQGLRKP
jgi:hypothetical protein